MSSLSCPSRSLALGTIFALAVVFAVTVVAMTEQFGHKPLSHAPQGKLGWHIASLLIM